MAINAAQDKNHNLSEALWINFVCVWFYFGNSSVQFSKVKFVEECCVERLKGNTHDLEFLSELDCSISPGNSSWAVTVWGRTGRVVWDSSFAASSKIQGLTLVPQHFPLSLLLAKESLVFCACIGKPRPQLRPCACLFLFLGSVGVAR